MWDRLEKFVQENREQMDAYEPRPQLWDKIDEHLQQHKEHNRWRVTAIAASLFAVVIMATCATMHFSNDHTQMATVTASINRDVQEAELYYTGIVEEKQEELYRYASAKPQLYHRFTTDLTDLQENYKLLKAEYMKSPEQEVVLAALVENLQLQIKILEQQLEIIKQVQHTTTDSTHHNII